MQSLVRKAEDFTTLTQREVALLRPDNVLGANSTNCIDRDTWVLGSEGHLLRNTFNCPWGLERLALEGYQNASDAIRKARAIGHTKVDPIYIKFTDTSYNIKNNGRLIPIEQHPSGKPVLYVLFYELNSTDNFAEPAAEGIPVIGLNGLGASLPGVYCTYFRVRGADGKHSQELLIRDHGKSYQCSDVVKCKPSDAFVDIYAEPDFAYFHYKEYTEADIDCFRAHAFFTAVTTRTDVIFEYEGKRGHTIDRYESMSLFKFSTTAFVSHEKPLTGQLWKHRGKYYAGKPADALADGLPLLEFAVYFTPNMEQHLAFYNGSLTAEGGGHVDCVLRAIASEVARHIDAGIRIGINDVRPHLSIAIMANDNEKSFNGNAKSRVEKFSPVVKFTDDQMEFIRTWGLRKHIETEAQHRLLSTIDTTGARIGRKTQYKDLLEANYACMARKSRNDKKPVVLIIVEGKSAGNTAIKFTDNDRDHFGVFFARGKGINPSIHDLTKVLKNEEVKALLDIIGLDIHADYSDKTVAGRLRYDQVRFFTDTDPDGDYIKVALINTFRKLSPSFARNRLWLVMFPLYYCENGAQKLGFYTTAEYNRWRDALPSLKGWKIKYAKGAGSFNGNENTVIRDKGLAVLQEVAFDDDSDTVLERCFARHSEWYRKELLANYDLTKDPGRETAAVVSVTDFVPTYLARFAYAAVKRALPGIDGQKEGMLKTMSAALDKWGNNLSMTMTAEAFGGYVKEVAGYHPGLSILYSVIANNTRSYPGAQNMALFEPDAMFADRVLEYDSQARYLGLTAKAWWKYQFPAAFRHIIPRVIGTSGKEEEYEHLAQTLPLVTINGARGPAYGWNCFIYPTNPMENADYITAKLTGKPYTKQIKPWFRGYKGTVELIETAKLSKKQQAEVKEAKATERDAEPLEAPTTPEEAEAIKLLEENAPVAPEYWGKWTLVTTGVLRILPNWVGEITELPINQTAFTYAKFLDSLVARHIVGGYDNMCKSPDTIRFLVYGMKDLSIEALQLRETWKLSNMNLFIDGKVVHFETYESIINAFMTHTLKDYAQRLAHERSEAEKIARKAAATSSLLIALRDGKLQIVNRDHDEIVSDCAALGINYEDVATGEMWPPSKQKIQHFEKAAQNAGAELERLLAMDEKNLWLEDIEKLRPHL